MSFIIDKGPYKIKKWGKNIDGEFIVDGYSYKGRKPFLKVLEGFKSMMTKGFVGDVNGVKINVKDSRIIGAELAIDIECSQNNNRGLAVLKLYGPSTKKQNVIMATKSKGSDAKYVVMLAEKVIDTLVEQFLNDGNVDKNLDETKVSEKEKNNKRNFCDKTTQTNVGLKRHITKMHRNEILNQIEQTGDDNSSSIVGSLLEELVETTNNLIDEDMKDDQKYQNKCDRCEFAVKADKRYVIIQSMKKHKEEECLNRTLKLNNQCDLCGYKDTSYTSLKRHKRDKHDIKTMSTSPPTKKLRQYFSFKSTEPMDIDPQEINEQQKRSDIMDEKIKEKERINEEKATILKNKKIEEDKRRKDMEAKLLEQSQKLNKKRKQSLKDQRKIANKKSKQKDVAIEDDVKNDFNQKIKEVPENCKHLVESNDVLYIVPGDGCCGPNSAAAFLFHDEIFGPMLRKKMNLHMVKFWETKYHKITQCSPGHPFERELGNKIVRFTDPEALKNFLQTEEAVYIWTDSEDLTVLSDIYQIKIKIITSKGKDDKHPTVNWIYPDRDMEEFAELKNVDLDIMVLFHENDCHFNLVIDNNSDLATQGSISTRLNVVMFENDRKIEKEGVEDDVKTANQNLKKELKICKQNKKNIETKYEECVKELKIKTEEAEKLRSEINDLRMIINLSEKLEQQESDRVAKEKKEVKRHISMNHTKDNNHELSSLKMSALNQQNSKSTGRKEVKYLKCEKCIFKTTSKFRLEEHNNLIHIQHRVENEDDEFNCKQCDFQTTSESNLKKHFVLKHTLKGLKPDEEIVCRNCGEKFIGKRNLMNHRKESHRHAVALCKNYQDGKCPYNSEKCWWNHCQKSTLDEETDVVACYNCDEKFKSKSDMMMHRKSKHEELVHACFNFLESNCRLQDSFCWFLHKEKDLETDEDKSKNNKKFTSEQENSVFWKVSGNKEPPLMKSNLKQKKE